MPDELDELFPNLAPYLRDQLSGPSQGQDDPAHGGVTMESVDQLMQGKVNPMFRPGVGAPAPKGGWEDGSNTSTTNDVPGRVTAKTNAPDSQPPDDDGHVDTGNREVPSTPPNQTTDGQSPPTPTPAEMPQPFQTEEGDQGQTPPKPNETPTDLAPSQTPSQTPAPDGEQFVRLGDTVIPRSQVESYLALDREMQSDPELRQMLADHFQRKYQVGSPTATQPSSPPTTQPVDPFANLPEEYRDDPLVQTVQAQLQAQQETIQRLSQFVEQSYEQTAQQRMVEFRKAADTAVMNFQRAHDLADDDMATLRKEAAQLNVVDKYLPTLGPVAAAEKALEIAFYSNATYREREIERVAKQQRQDSAKKQKLAAINGSSGSVPRSQPAPTTPEGNRAAMIDAVANMMNGTWTGDNN